MAMPFFVHQFAGLPYPPSDATKAQTDAFNIPAWRQSLIVSILSAGTFFGALAAGDIADFIGRRPTIITGCAVFTLGVVLQVSALCRGKCFGQENAELLPSTKILSYHSWSYANFNRLPQLITAFSSLVA